MDFMALTDFLHFSKNISSAQIHPKCWRENTSSVHSKSACLILKNELKKRKIHPNRWKSSTRKKSKLNLTCLNNYFIYKYYSTLPSSRYFKILHEVHLVFHSSKHIFPGIFTLKTVFSEQRKDIQLIYLHKQIAKVL